MNVSSSSNCFITVWAETRLRTMPGRDTGVSRELMALTGRELRRVQNRVLLLVKSAEQRVAGFLLEMAERARSANVVELPRRAFPSPGWR